MLGVAFKIGTPKWQWAGQKVVRAWRPRAGRRNVGRPKERTEKEKDLGLEHYGLARGDSPNNIPIQRVERDREVQRVLTLQI